MWLLLLLVVTADRPFVLLFFSFSFLRFFDNWKENRAVEVFGRIFDSRFQDKD